MLIKNPTTNKLDNKEFGEICRVWGVLHYDASGGGAPTLTPIPKTRKLFNRVLETYTKTQFMAMVFCHFEWHGPLGNNVDEWLNLYQTNFSVGLFVHKRDRYAAYIRQTLGSDVWDDPDKLTEVVYYWLKRLFSQNSF